MCRHNIKGYCCGVPYWNDSVLRCAMHLQTYILNSCLSRLKRALKNSSTGYRQQICLLSLWMWKVDGFAFTTFFLNLSKTN